MNVQERLRFTADFIDAVCREANATCFQPRIVDHEATYELFVKDCPRAHNLYGSNNDSCWIILLNPHKEQFRCYTVVSSRAEAIKLFIENDLELQYTRICDGKEVIPFSQFKNGTEAGEYAAAKVNAVFDLMDIAEKLSKKAKKLAEAEFEKVPFLK